MENNNLVSQIYIKGIPYNISERDVRVRFEQFGSIKNIILKKGYCFIDYFNEKHAKEAIDAMNDKILDGMIIKVSASIDKRQRNNNNYNRGERHYDRQNANYERKKGPQPNDLCHNCKEPGHWANECRVEKKAK